MPSFTDGFEAATLNPFWATTEISGFVTMPSTEHAHSGTQSVKFTSTNTSLSKNVGLSHEFGTPTYGRLSIWVYDTGANQASSNQFWFSMSNSVLGKGALLAAADYGIADGATYYWDVGGNTAHVIPRTQAWHQFTFDSKPTGLTLQIDGQTVYSDSSATPFTSVFFKMVAPSWRPAWTSYWDDFEFQEYVPANQPPVLSPIGNHSIGEGSPLAFTATATDPDAGQTLTYSLDSAPPGAAIDPSSGVFTWTPDDGPGSVQVTVRVTDNGTPALSDTETFTITVGNVPPVASVTGPSTGVRGQSRTFTLGASDPSSGDQGAGFTYDVAWGDGTTQTVTGPSGLQVAHTYSESGTFIVGVTATDKDGGTSDTVAQVVSIAPVEVQGTTLVVGGTLAGDRIVFNPGGPGDSVKVIINGVAYGPFTGVSSLLAYGQAGDDHIRVAGGLDLFAILHGDDGNDSLKVGRGNSVLDGGTGFLDVLLGGQGDDVLMDPDGVARASGGNGDDDITIYFAPDWNFHNSPSLPGGAISGKNGDDTIRVTSNNARMKFDVSGDKGNDRIELTGTWAKVRVSGRSGSDTLKDFGIGLLELNGIELEG